MGLYNAPEKCFITGMETENVSNGYDGIEYFVTFNNEHYFFQFHRSHQNSDFVQKNLYIIIGLMLKKQFPYSNKEPYFDNEKLERIIKQASIPQSPKAKMDNLILFLYSHQKSPGEYISFNVHNDWNLTLCSLFFASQKEYFFYLNTLKETGLITFNDATSKYGSGAINIKLTFKGLQYIIELQESGEKSKKCFIAMSFSEKANGIREVIKKAVVETGFDPILVDEQHYESDITINDAIIKFIRKSKFLIADFTEQKHGVYFEAGFALGLKRPVIYTCSKEDFHKTHFDTNHYPHIVYSDLDELLEKLKDKIEAWID